MVKGRLPDHVNKAVGHVTVDIQADLSGAVDQFGRFFVEAKIQSRLSHAGAASQEVETQQRLATPWDAQQHRRGTGEQSAVQHGIELGHAEGHTISWPWLV